MYRSNFYPYGEICHISYSNAWLQIHEIRVELKHSSNAVYLNKIHLREKVMLLSTM